MFLEESKSRDVIVLNTKQELFLEHPHPSRYFLCPRTPSSVYRNLFLAIFGAFLAPVLRYF
jgi:hypothetical protein